MKHDGVEPDNGDFDFIDEEVIESKARNVGNHLLRNWPWYLIGAALVLLILF